MCSARYADPLDGPPLLQPPVVIQQWASRVVAFSSQYTPTGWSANQILGRPKVFPGHGDVPGAWTSSVWNAPQFIEVEFDTAVRVHSIHIYETLNPGSVVKVRARESSGPWTLLWHTDRPVRLIGCRIFSPTITESAKMMKVNQIRIELDMTAASYWSELDAVQLVGVRDGAAIATIDDSRFVDDMSNLVNKQQYSDIELDIGGKILYGHRAILASRSPYMARLFNSNQSAKTIQITSLSFDDVKTALHVLYTNRLPIGVSTNRLVTMCKASAMFEVLDLKTAAIVHLMERIRSDNVVDIYMHARDDPQLSDVKNICQSFMASNLKEMSLQPSFKTMPQDDMVLVVQAAMQCLNTDQSGNNSDAGATSVKQIDP